MAVFIRCPECNKKLQVPSKLLGTASTCPKCKQGFQIPEKGEPVIAIQPVDVESGKSQGSSVRKLSSNTHQRKQAAPKHKSSRQGVWIVIAATLLISPGLIYLGMQISQWTTSNEGTVASNIEASTSTASSAEATLDSGSPSDAVSEPSKAGQPIEATTEEMAAPDIEPSSDQVASVPDNEMASADANVEEDAPTPSNDSDEEIVNAPGNDPQVAETNPADPNSDEAQVAEADPDPAETNDGANEMDTDPPNEEIADNEAESKEPTIDPVDPIQEIDVNDKSKNAVIQRVKDATAYVITPRKTGSAFCIDSTGLFVTNAHVIADVRKSETIKLVLNTDSNRPIRLFAKVEEIETDADLALLSVSRSGPFPTLELGTSDGLFETSEIVAFGYPFGDALTLRGEDYPSISVNVGRVTALRKKGKKLKLIQLDAEINPGNSGGPVVDSKGKVVGIVQATIKDGAGINFAIPIEEVGVHLLDKPVVTFQVPEEVKAADLAKPITATLTVSNRSGKPLEGCLATVDVNTTGETINLTQQEQNVFSAKFNLVRMADYQDVMFDAFFETNKISGKLANQEITVLGDKPLRINIRDISSLSKKGADATEFELKKTNGTRFKCKLPDDLWKAVSVKLAGREIDVDLQDANRIEFRGAEFPDTVKLDASFAVADDEIWTDRYTIRIEKESGAKDDVVRRRDSERKEITNVELNEPKSLKLPDNIDDVCFGASGRLMFVSLPLIRQIAVVDFASKKVETYLAAPESNFFMAAGRDRFVVVETEKNILRSYDIYDFESVVSKRIDMEGTVMGLGLGSASTGPLVVIGMWNRRSEIGFFDPDRLKPIELKRIGIQGYRIDASSQSRIRASANGMLFTISSGSRGADVLRIRGSRFEVLSIRESLGLAIPSPDGRDIYTSRGLFSTSQLSDVRSREQTSATLIPALHGELYLRLTSTSPSFRSNSKPKVWLHQRGSKEPLGLVAAATEAIAEKEIQPTSTNYHFTLDKKLVLAPKYNVLAIVRESIIDLYPFKIKDIISADGLDYLTVVSTPVTSATINDSFEYAIKVESSIAKVDYSLEVKPSGMSVSRDGVIRWRPKPFHKGQPNQVVVKITAGDDLEIHHSFGIELR